MVYLSNTLVLLVVIMSSFGNLLFVDRTLVVTLLLWEKLVMMLVVVATIVMLISYNTWSAACSISQSPSHVGSASSSATQAVVDVADVCVC